jgi:hypothetical protein
VGILYFGSAIPALPLEWYKTFVLEEKHGFNKTTPGLFVADTLKGWAVGAAIGAPFLAGFLRVFSWAGDRFVPWLMGFLYVFFFLVTPTSRVLKMHQGCVPALDGRAVPDCHPAAFQQAFAPPRGRASYEDRVSGLFTQVPAEAPIRD